MRKEQSREAAGWTPSQRRVLAVTAVAALLVGLDALVVATALSTVREDLGASVEQLEWTVNAYTLAFAVLMMPASALGDRFGRLRVFVAGLAVFAAASVGCALAGDVNVLIAARAVQGAGAAAVMPLALALLSAAVSAAQRAVALGVFTGVVGASVPLGPLFGGAVVEGVSWPWIFWANVPVAAVLIAVAVTRLEDSRGPRTALDLPGLGLVTVAAFGIVWGLVRGNPVGWGGTEVVAALLLGVGVGAVFVAWEARAAEPMLPMRLFRSRAVAAGTAGIFFVAASAFGSVYFMAQYMQDALGHGPLQAGVRLMPWGAVTVIVPRVVGARVARTGERPFVVAGAACNAVGLAWVAWIAEPGMAYGEMVAPMVLSGAGVAMAITATQSAVLGAVAPADIGKASGAYSMIRQLGSAFGVAVAVAVFSAWGSYASARSFSDGFVRAVAVAAAMSFAAALCGIALPAKPSPGKRPPAPADSAPTGKADRQQTPAGSA
jgi:EmrB/QacA subfamily drug resistance transporter